MLITAIGLVLVLATALALAWPLLASPPGEPEAAASPEASSRLESERDAVLAAIREADFDHETGKLSDEDHRALRAELEERALGAFAALDRAAVPPKGQTPPSAGAAAAARGTAASFCPACGQRRKDGAEFCGGCGRRLAPSGEAERRRA
jgi:hypothetical protein